MACCFHVVICVHCFLLQDIDYPNPTIMAAENKIEQLGENNITSSRLPHTTLSKTIENSLNNFLLRNKAEKKVSVRSFSRDVNNISEETPFDTKSQVKL